MSEIIFTDQILIYLVDSRVIEKNKVHAFLYGNEICYLTFDPISDELNLFCLNLIFEFVRMCQ